MVMKKIFTLILMVSILISCSDWKYSNGVKRHKRSYVYSNPKSTTEKDISTENEITVSVIDEQITTQNQTVESAESAVESQSETTENSENQIILVNTKNLENDEDSLKSLSQSAVDEALDAEKKGKLSHIFGIAGLILQLIPLIGSLIGLIFSLIALSAGIQSLKAKYNTPEGLKMARTGVILSSIVVGLYALLLIFVLVIAVLFLIYGF
jgi:TolA-binding protein